MCTHIFTYTHMYACKFEYQHVTSSLRDVFIRIVMRHTHKRINNIHRYIRTYSHKYARMRVCMNIKISLVHSEILSIGAVIHHTHNHIHSIHIYKYTRIYIHAHVCVYIWISTCHQSTLRFAHRCGNPPHTQTHTQYTRIQLYTYLHTCWCAAHTNTHTVYTYTNTYIFTYMLMYACIYENKHVTSLLRDLLIGAVMRYTHTHIHSIHICIPTYSHTCTCMRVHMNINMSLVHSEICS